MNRILSLLLLAFCLAGCASPTFQREWRAARQQALPTANMLGPWEGTWRSTPSGHHGKLRCLVTPSATTGQHDFHYWATWSVFQGAFRTSFPARQRGEKTTFAGDFDLGRLGGIYQHAGEAMPTKFEATYRSAKDHGVFSLQRPR